MRIHHWRSMAGRGLAYLAAIGLLLAVFALYTNPDFLVTLADQIWACF